VNCTVLVHEAVEGGFWAEVAELPGCYTQGESLEEIEENVKDAIQEYFHALKFAGKETSFPAVDGFTILLAVEEP